LLASVSKRHFGGPDLRRAVAHVKILILQCLQVIEEGGPTLVSTLPISRLAAIAEFGICAQAAGAAKNERFTFSRISRRAQIMRGKGEQGFTLIELLIVVAIISIIAAI